MTPSSTHNDENDCIVVSDITNPSGYRDFVDKDVKPKVRQAAFVTSRLPRF